MGVRRKATTGCPSATWTEVDQAAHTALWSLHLGLPDDWRSSRFLKRYRIMPVPFAAQLLEYELATQRAPGSSSLSGAVRSAHLKLALWTLSPYFETILAGQSASLRSTFREMFGHEPAAFPPDGPDRPFLPAIHELGIESATVRTRAFRRSNQIRVEAEVRHPLRDLRAMAYPWNWDSCPFWTGLPPRDPSVTGSWSGRCTPALRLPGGLRIERSKPKERLVHLEADVAAGPFAVRIDYEGGEDRDANSRLAAERLGSERAPTPLVQAETRVEDDADGTPGGGQDAFEMGGFHGYLLVEKMPGKPQVCRVVLEKTASFNDPNHAYFDKQTLWYWAASELIAFVARATRADEPATD